MKVVLDSLIRPPSPLLTSLSLVPIPTKYPHPRQKKKPTKQNPPTYPKQTHKTQNTQTSCS